MNLKTCTYAIALLALCMLSIAPAHAADVHLAAKQADAAQTFGKLISDQGTDVVKLAEAMPADKFGFAPTQGQFKGVRTFGQQITHVAEAQYYFFGGFGVKPTVDPKTLAKLSGKDEIIKALKDSFAFAREATDTITAENAFAEIESVDGTNTRLSIAAFSLAHTNDHYGQMIEYLRMNGIVPPGSR